LKALHRSDLFGWSRFDEARNVDFNSVAWVRPGGNVLVDPLPLSPHDEAHLVKLGGAALIVLTNSEHVRDAAHLRERFGAKVLGPAAERASFSLPCDCWLSSGSEAVPGLRAFALDGSKTPGELVLLLEETTLITGDLIRGQRGGALNLLPDAKLKDKAAAVASVRALLAHAPIEAVLVGDGWPVFRDGLARLTELVA
jgi:hypothetical protein